MSKIMLLMFIILIILGGIGINKIIQDSNTNSQNGENSQINGQNQQSTGDQYSTSSNVPPDNSGSSGSTGDVSSSSTGDASSSSTIDDSSSSQSGTRPMQE